jgi:hypothetical protein
MLPFCKLKMNDPYSFYSQLLDSQLLGKLSQKLKILIIFLHKNQQVIFSKLFVIVITYILGLPRKMSITSNHGGGVL